MCATTETLPEPLAGAAAAMGLLPSNRLSIFRRQACKFRDQPDIGHKLHMSLMSTGGAPKVCGGGTYHPRTGFSDVTDKCWEWDHGKEM